MKHISIIFCLFQASVAFGQWTDLTSSRNDIVFINESTGWMAGTAGSFLKTTDGGKTWFNQKSPIEFTNEEIVQIAVFNGGTTFMVLTRKSGLGRIYTSSDSGVTWKRIAMVQNFELGMHFTSASVGWYWVIPEGYNNEAVYHTTDGGLTWTVVPELFAIGELTTNGNNVWAIQHRYFNDGYKTILWRSTDSGSTWTSNEIDPLFLWDYYLPKLQFFDSQNGWLCTKNLLYKTTNGGTTWVQATPPVFNNVWVSEFLFVNQTIGYAYGLDNFYNIHRFFKTTDSGATWTTIYSFHTGVDGFTSNIPNDIKVLYFKDANTGVAAGNDGLYMETTDGGLTWETTNHCIVGATSSTTMDIEFNGSDIWTSSRHVAHSSKDGVTWKNYRNLPEPVTYDETAIAFRGNGKGLIVSDLRYIRTLDNGLTWNLIAPSFEYSGDAINAKMWYDKVGNLWIKKSNGTLYKSVDDGITFKISYKPASFASLSADRYLEFQSEKKIWYYGQNKLIKSIDGGVTWTQTTQTIQRLQFLSEDIGFKLTDNKNLYKTIDGGETWMLVSAIDPIPWFQFIYFADEQVGWAGSKSGPIFKTINGGITWTNENTGMLNEYYDMAFSKNAAGEVIGYLAGDGLLRLTSHYVPQPIINLSDVTVEITSSGSNFTSLAWTDNSSVDDGFLVQRKLINGTFATIATSTSTTFTDNTVEPGKAYVYRVAIYKTNRAIRYSNEVSVKASQLITFQEIPQKVFGDPDFNLVATNTSGLPVIFTSSQPAIASVTGSKVAILGVGEVTITASAVGNASFLPAVAERAFRVVPANQTITFVKPEDVVIGSSAFSIQATATSGLPVSFSSASDHVSISGNTVTLLNPGSVTILASQAGNNFYNEAPAVEHVFCINPAKPTIDVSEPTGRTVVLTSSQSSGNHWYKDGVEISGETSNSLATSTEGSYAVMSTVEGCSSVLSDAYILVITGLDNETRKAIRLFPNPATDKIKLYLSTRSYSPMEVQILDVYGKEVSHYTVPSRTQPELNISFLTQGVYFLRITENGNPIILRFVKR